MPFRLIRQLDAMQCGVASLAMVCGHHGLRCSVKWLEDYCTPTTEGVSLKGIADAARDVGLDTVAARVTVEQLAEAPLPAILHWNQNHFVVLYRIGRFSRKYYIADPGKGKMRLSRGELEKHWLSTTSGGERKGIAMFLEPTEKFGRLREEHTGKRRSLSFLNRYLREFRPQFVKIFLALLVGSLLQLVLPFLTQAIVDTGISRRDIGLIWLILLGELAIVAGRTATDFFRRWILLRVSMRINISLVSDFFIKLLRLPMSFFDTKLMGDLLQRIGDHSRVQSFLTTQALGIMFTALSFIVFGIVLLVYDPTVFLVFLAGSAAYGLWIAAFLRRRKVIDYELFERQALNQNRTYQFVTSMQEIKLQDCERRRREEWEQTQADLYGVQMKSLRLQQNQEAGSILINEIKNILITVLAATSVINGQITLGAMLAIQYIVGQLTAPVEQLMAFVYSLQDVRISLERINEVHERREEEEDRGGITEYGGERSVVFSGVGFRYDRHSPRMTLEDISFAIPAGKVTAVVGASGSGKTTLLKLMLGYYPVERGEITVAGRPLDDYSVRWWRRRCGVVMQDGVIFSESIARNIAVDDGDIDDGRMREAARIACIGDYIESLPLKYDTKIGRDGVGLSQGQRQRILIARAVYRNPDFILLDEATNALDARNERAIVENLAEFYRGRTVVVVAHRLSTVRDADRIIVLDKGHVAETGTHASLIALRGVYHTLVKNQLELGN